MMKYNQSHLWPSLGLMLALAFILGLSSYLPLTVAAAQQTFVAPSDQAALHVNFMSKPTAVPLMVATLNYTLYLPIIVVPPSLVDNFDDGQDPNVLGGYSSFAWHVPCPRTIRGDYDPLNPYNGAYSYRLSYNVTPICYGVWQTDLRDLNFSGFSTLTFWIRGASGGEKVHIYLQDRDDCQLAICRYFVNVNSYLPAGKVTTTWQEARIPLSVFTTKEVNLTRLRFFQVVFEYDNLAGTIYVDEIRFK